MLSRKLRAMRLRAELDAAREQLAALSQWQCQSCGARFGDKVFPPAVLDGVTRCSACVRAKIAETQLAAAEFRLQTIRNFTESTGARPDMHNSQHVASTLMRLLTQSLATLAPGEQKEERA